MTLQLGKRFWVAATVVIVVYSMFVVGRNLLHGISIKRQINALTREKDIYRGKIDQDSTLLEQLRYDDYLEEFARENFQMRRSDEEVYIIKE